MYSACVINIGLSVCACANVDTAELRMLPSVISSGCLGEETTEHRVTSSVHVYNVANAHFIYQFVGISYMSAQPHINCLAFSLTIIEGT